MVNNYCFLSSTVVLDNCIPLLIQQNINDGSAIFNRSWAEYKLGFNDSSGNYWLGNELIHQLTVSRNFRLRIDLKPAVDTAQWYWAEYSSFVVQGEEANYKLIVGGFTGNTGHDALSNQNRMMFSTYDRDNDLSSGGNCAVQFPNRRGFWFKRCFVLACCLTCSAGSELEFHWHNLPGSNRVKVSRMWLTCPY